jgi:hypothetical protein
VPACSRHASPASVSTERRAPRRQAGREVEEVADGGVIGFLMGRGVDQEGAWKLAASGKGWWRLTASHQAKTAMTNAWFQAQGLVSLAAHHDALNTVGNRRVRGPYARWWPGGAPGVLASRSSTLAPAPTASGRSCCSRSHVENVVIADAPGAASDSAKCIGRQNHTERQVRR